MKKILTMLCTVATLTIPVSLASAAGHGGGHPGGGGGGHSMGGHAGGGHPGGGSGFRGGHVGGGGHGGGGGWVGPAVLGGAILGGGAYMLNRSYDDSDCWQYQRVVTPNGYVANRRVFVCNDGD